MKLRMLALSALVVLVTGAVVEAQAVRQVLYKGSGTFSGTWPTECLGSSVMVEGEYRVTITSLSDGSGGFHFEHHDVSQLRGFDPEGTEYNGSQVQHMAFHMGANQQYPYEMLRNINMTLVSRGNGPNLIAKTRYRYILNGTGQIVVARWIDSLDCVGR